MAEQRVLSNGKKSSVFTRCRCVDHSVGGRPGKDRACDEKPDVAARRSSRSWPVTAASPHAFFGPSLGNARSLHGGERVGRQASDCVGSHRHARTEAVGSTASRHERWTGCDGAVDGKRDIGPVRPPSRMPDRLATATEALSAPEQIVLLTSLVKVIRSLPRTG